MIIRNTHGHWSETDYTQQIKQYIVHNVRSEVDIQIQMGGRSKQG